MVESALLTSVVDGSVLCGAAQNDGGGHLPALGGHGAAEYSNKYRDWLRNNRQVQRCTITPEGVPNP